MKKINIDFKAVFKPSGTILFVGTSNVFANSENAVLRLLNANTGIF